MVFLTSIGGGAFGNPQPWILTAISRGLMIFATTDLDVVMVSYGQANAAVQPLISQYSPTI